MNQKEKRREELEELKSVLSEKVDLSPKERVEKKETPRDNDTSKEVDVESNLVTTESIVIESSDVKSVETVETVKTVQTVETANAANAVKTANAVQTVKTVNAVEKQIRRREITKKFLLNIKDGESIGNSITNISNLVERMVKVGAGCYGKSFSINFYNDSRTYLIKEISKKLCSYDVVQTEFGLQTMAHSICPTGVAKTYSFFSSTSSYFLLLEYIEGDTLFNLRNTLTVSQVTDIFDSLMAIVRNLHEGNICHTDISLANVVLSRGKPYLIDFGFAFHKDWMKSNSCTIFNEVSVRCSPEYIAICLLMISTEDKYPERCRVANFQSIEDVDVVSKFKKRYAINNNFKKIPKSKRVDILLQVYKSMDYWQIINGLYWLLTKKPYYKETIAKENRYETYLQGYFSWSRNWSDVENTFMLEIQRVLKGPEYTLFLGSIRNYMSYLCLSSEEE